MGSITTPPSRTELDRVERDSNSMLTASNVNSLIVITANSFTQTFDAPASLGAGWFCEYKNEGSGEITIPDSDGVNNWKMYSGEHRLFTCDGASISSEVINPHMAIFTASGSYIVPPRYKAVGVQVAGAGAGGGSGRRGAAGSSRAGGSGGGGGALRREILNSIAAGTSVTVTIGAGGTGGAAVEVNDTDGNNGTAGGNSSFGSYVTAYGGGFGCKGIAAASAGGGGGGAGGAGGNGDPGAAGVAGGLPSATNFGDRKSVV